MTICLQHDSFGAVLADVRRAVEDLSETRARAARDVSALLDGGWSGTAAASFAEGWADWVDAAGEVESALSGLAGALGLARSGLAAADHTGGDAMARITGRLG